MRKKIAEAIFWGATYDVAKAMAMEYFESSGEYWANGPSSPLR
ncbi:MAG: hypothetical protein ACK5L7_03605 [Paludibacteraceae bacterium]